MKNTLFIFLVMIICAFSGDSSWKDGQYTGVSRSFYTQEPFYGFTTLTIDNGRITGVAFYIRDSMKHEYFDDQYERYYTGNAIYIDQCRNDRKGIISYPDSLLKYQELDKVDVISGATWSYNIFKASAGNALRKASNE